MEVIRCKNCGKEIILSINNEIICDFCSNPADWRCIDGKDRCQTHFKKWWLGKRKKWWQIWKN